MEVNVNWLAVVLAALSTMVVGSVWYARPVFGNLWIKLAKVDMKKAEKASWAPLVITLLVTFVTSFVLAHVAVLSNSYFGNSFLQDTMATAVWVWAGFTAARFLTHDAFEFRPMGLTILNITHELVTFLVMGLIIGLLPPAL